MFGPTAAYVVAIFALVFCSISALALINTVRHLDPPPAGESPEQGALLWN
jgi:hypothetical protein